MLRPRIRQGRGIVIGPAKELWTLEGSNEIAKIREDAVARRPTLIANPNIVVPIRLHKGHSDTRESNRRLRRSVVRQRRDSEEEWSPRTSQVKIGQHNRSIERRRSSRTHRRHESRHVIYRSSKESSELEIRSCGPWLTIGSRSGRSGWSRGSGGSRHSGRTRARRSGVSRRTRGTRDTGVSSRSCLRVSRRTRRASGRSRSRGSTWPCLLSCRSCLRGSRGSCVPPVSDSDVASPSGRTKDSQIARSSAETGPSCGTCESSWTCQSSRPSRPCG